MKIFVGMSGGVDSSVSAALLQEQGHEVLGVFIKGWYPPEFPCTWREDRLDAMRVAAHLKIPFHTLDLSKEYKQSVVDYLVSEYKHGRTPNPDTLCNRDIKFGHFFAWARAHGADAIATGHYAQTHIVGKGTQLLRGKSDAKDQSYFLYTLTQKELPFVLFPIGGYEKSKVRKIAEAKQLPVATKPDSQGLCFLGKLNMEDFLTTYIPQHPGVILNTQGITIGKHVGIHYYTLGQRHGIGGEGGSKEPQYILSKDIEKNTITIGSRKILETNAPQKVVLSTLSWTQHKPDETMNLVAQYRYHGPKIPIRTLLYTGEILSISFKEKLEDTPSAGQALVLYRGDECLGGGMII